MDQVIYELKALLIKELQETREQAKRLPESAAAQAFIDRYLRTLESMVIVLDKSIKEGVIDMNKIRTEIKTVRTGSIEELMIATRGGKIEPNLKELASQLEPGQFAEIDPETISWAHFSGRIYAMKKDGRMDSDIFPMKRGDKFFMVRYSQKDLKAMKAAK